MLDGDLDLGPVTGTYYSLFQKEISNISTVTPSLFNKTRRINWHNVSVTRYESVLAYVNVSYFLRFQRFQT